MTITKLHTFYCMDMYINACNLFVLYIEIWIGIRMTSKNSEDWGFELVTVRPSHKVRIDKCLSI